MKKCLFTFRFGDMARFLPDLPGMLKAHDIELIVSLLGRNHTEDELIAKTEKLTGNEKLRAELANKAQQTAKNFSDQKFCMELKKIIK